MADDFEGMLLTNTMQITGAIHADFLKKDIVRTSDFAMQIGPLSHSWGPSEDSPVIRRL